MEKILKTFSEYSNESTKYASDSVAQMGYFLSDIVKISKEPKWSKHRDFKYTLINNGTFDLFGNESEILSEPKVATQIKKYFGTTRLNDFANAKSSFTIEYERGDEYGDIQVIILYHEKKDIYLIIDRFGNETQIFLNASKIKPKEILDWVLNNWII